MTETDKLAVGDRVALTVSCNDRESGRGTIRRLVAIEMDNGHWVQAWPCHVYRVREVTP